MLVPIIAGMKVKDKYLNASSDLSNIIGTRSYYVLQSNVVHCFLVLGGT